MKCNHHDEGNSTTSGFSLMTLLRITGKFPGYLSPSAGLKFADVPNGLAAISKASDVEMDV